ncbi:hypothetical protein MOKP101_48070 [Mycobacterium avium subsp. hominissuis]
MLAITIAAIATTTEAIATITDGSMAQNVQARELDARYPACVPDPTAEEINACLDSEEINTADARDATHWRAIRAAVNAADDDELCAAVAATRDAGDSWAIIGIALGTSRQNAYSGSGTTHRPKEVTDTPGRSGPGEFSASSSR